MNDSTKWFWVVPLACNLANFITNPEVSSEFLQPDIAEIPYYAFFTPEECKNNPISSGVLGVTTATTQSFG